MADDRLFADVAAALADRQAIDWLAVRTERNRRALDVVSRFERTATLPPRTPMMLVARALTVLAACECLCAIAILIDALGGESIQVRVPQGLAAIAFAAASVPLGLATARDPRSAFLLTTFALSAAVFARSATSSLAVTWSGAFGAVFGSLWLEALIPASLWQFALGFPPSKRFTIFDRAARPVTFATWVLGAAFLLVNVVASAGSFGASTAVSMLRNHPRNIFWLAFAATAIPPTAVIYWRALTAPPNERRRAQRLAIALFSGAVPVLGWSLIRSALPLVDQRFAIAPLDAHAPAYWLILAGLCCTPVTTTALVVRERPFDWQASPGRPSIHTVALIAIGAIAGTPILALLVYLHGLEWNRAVWVPLSAFGASAIAGLVLWLARIPALATIERITTKRSPTHLADAIDRVSLAPGAREALVAAAGDLASALGVSASVLLLDRNRSFVSWPAGDVTLPASAGPVAIARAAGQPIDVSADGELGRLLTRVDRQWVTAHEISLIAPVARLDALVALVIFKKKRSGFPFSQQDRALISNLLTVVAAVWSSDLSALTTNTPDIQHDADRYALECPSCGAVSSQRLPCDCGRAPQLAALPPILASAFIVERRLGAGGMGIVYLARDQRLGRHVALKTLPKLETRAIAQLHAEARAMAALNHPSLATLYALEMWHATPVLIVEFFSGGTLRQRLSNGSLPERDAAALGIRLAAALAYMHAAGAIHGDIKASNIAFSASGVAKLMDFGLSTLAASATEMRTHNALSQSMHADVRALADVLRQSIPHASRTPFALFLDRACQVSANGGLTASAFLGGIETASATVGVHPIP